MNLEDKNYITDLVKKSGTSFYHGMKILPAERRNAMYAIYAFCRVVDDIADEETTDLQGKKEQLNIWRQLITALYETGRAENHISRALLSVIKDYKTKQEDFIAVIDGMEMDAGLPIIAPSLAELDLYCDRVASAVGRLSVRVFGDSSPKADEVAYNLGRGLQLTNILRDVAEDAKRGRIYLPSEFLNEANVSKEPSQILSDPGLPLVCKKISEMAQCYFEQANKAMAQCKPSAMKPARMMEESYRPILNILSKRGFDYTQGRASLPKWRKLKLAARLLVKL